MDCGYTFFTYIINKYISETDHAAKTHFVGRPKKMNEFDDDINIREQVFHNAIREYVVSCFNFFYSVVQSNDFRKFCVHAGILFWSI